MAFTLADTAWLEGFAFDVSDDCYGLRPRRHTQLDGLAFNFGNDGYGLRPRQHSSARVARLLLQRRLLRPFALADTPRLEGLALYFGDDDFGFGHRPRRHCSTGGARFLLRPIRDIGSFGYASRRIFAPPPATTSGQEGLGTGRTSITLRIKSRLALEGGEPKTLYPLLRLHQPRRTPKNQGSAACAMKSGNEDSVFIIVKDPHHSRRPSSSSRTLITVKNPHHRRRPWSSLRPKSRTSCSISSCIWAR
jgi:hypothetical protein